MSVRSAEAWYVTAAMAGLAAAATLGGMGPKASDSLSDPAGSGTEALVGAIGPRGGANGFVNWETPHVHPLAMTPDGTKLLAVNTADARLEVFDLTSGLPRPIGAVPVGVDPVSVRARTNGEAWVVNHISDTVSVVDLASMNVVRTVKVADEPCDVVSRAARRS